MRTIYIAGPMTGLPEMNYPAFFDAEDKLCQKGLLVNNPAAIRKHPDDLHGDQIWQYYIRLAIPMVLASTEIAFLPGWLDSRGARLEAFIGMSLSMRTWDYRDGELYDPGSMPSLNAHGNLSIPMVQEVI